MEIRERTGAWVSATVQENLWAGAGAGVLTFVGGYAVSGYSDALAVATLLVAGAGFGILCVIRFSMDEWRLVYDLHMQRSAENAIIELETTVAELRAELKRANIEARTNEFKVASKQARVFAPVDEDAQLRADVQNVIKRWGANAKFGRDHCEIGRARWERATSFLVHCGVMVLSDDGRKQRVFADGMTPPKAESHVRDAFGRIDKHKNTNFTPALA